MKIRAIILFLSAAGAALAQLAVPRLGCFVDAEHRLRPVLGVTGNFLLGEPEADDVIAAACSGDLTVIKRADSLEVRDRDGARSWPAPEGPALVGLSERQSSALVYYPATGKWFRVNRYSMFPLRPPEGEVFAVGVPERPAAVVRRDGALWITGAVERPLPGDAEEPLLLLGDGSVLFMRGTEMVIFSAGESESSVSLPGPATAIERLGRGWLRVSLADEGGHLAIALPDCNRVFRLPEVAQ
jgi:hypothetical protein